ncbi:hypothetical protein H8356DRAFT_1321725 [Neocallimastix lanati (nom. inval.)]|nr:hypothetical protein H8356DRAFT_1321725 [Neocallimastix sp. JGI-2020a]
MRLTRCRLRQLRFSVSFYVTNTSGFEKNNDNSTNNGNIILTFPLKVYSLESYERELQHMLKLTLLDN